MTKQELARHRNWNKARLSGMSFDTRVFTEQELALLQKIQNLKEELLQHWDFNSKLLDLKVERYNVYLNNTMYKVNISYKEALYCKKYSDDEKSVEIRKITFDDKART